MSGRFLARGAFQSESRGLFVVHGALLDGMVRVGQIASAPGFKARVHGVEHVRLNASEEDLALTFLPPSHGDVAGWIALQLAGGELTLSEA